MRLGSARASGVRGLARIGLALALTGLAGCGTALYVADYTASQAVLTSAAGLRDADLDNLRSGRIDLVAGMLEARPVTQLTPQQLNLYCDVLLKLRDFQRATACLDQLERRAGRSPVIDGKRALSALALGNPQDAARLTESGGSPGLRYVHALAQARLGQLSDARRAAGQFAKQYEPRQVFYAVSLYSALGDDAAALGLLEDPSRRLLRDYGLTRTATALGTGEQAPFRLDIFDDLGLGLLGNYSYAPAANVYVEYLAAHSLLQLGRVQEAVKRLDELLASPALPAYKDVEWLVFYDRGRAARQLRQNQQARSFFERSVADIESARRSVYSDEGRIGFVAQKQDVYAALVDLLRESGQVDEALNYAERARGRAFVDLLASRDNLVPREISPRESAELLTGLDRAEGRDFLAASVPAGSSGLRGVGASDLRRQIERRAPSLAPIISVSPVTLPQIRSTLAPDETAVAYYRIGSEWIAFVVTSRDIRIVPLPPIDNAAVLGFLKDVVSSGSGDRTFMAGGQALYNSLIRPVDPFITGQRVVFVPYGILHYLPFAALHDGRAYLVEKRSIRQVPSLSASVIAKGDRARGAGSLVLGNPARGGDAPPLPNAEQEAASVGGMLPQSTVLIGRQATIGRFRALAPGKEYLHVASHGEFNAKAPLRSRLLLAPDEGETGDLTVESLYTLRLDARLVTLSACQTAVSLVSDGDDLVGLVRGFLFAGAQNVVATLWEVSDVTTGELVSDFYRGLASSRSITDALRLAQLSMMKRRPEPFHWAAFTPMSFAPQL